MRGKRDLSAAPESLRRSGTDQAKRGPIMMRVRSTAGVRVAAILVIGLLALACVDPEGAPPPRATAVIDAASDASVGTAGLFGFEYRDLPKRTRRATGGSIRAGGVRRLRSPVDTNGHSWHVRRNSVGFACRCDDSRGSGPLGSSGADCQVGGPHPASKHLPKVEGVGEQYLIYNPNVVDFNGAQLDGCHSGAH